MHTCSFVRLGAKKDSKKDTNEKGKKKKTCKQTAFSYMFMDLFRKKTTCNRQSTDYSC